MRNIKHINAILGIMFSLVGCLGLALTSDNTQRISCMMCACTGALISVINNQKDNP